MVFDPKVPESLKKMQVWFSDVITRPLEEVQKGESYVKPSKRIEIYHEQYWLRLLEVMRKSFPTVTSLLGVKKFNETIAAPYLLAHPSNHWDISFIGKKLGEFAKLVVKEPLILDAIDVDWAYQECFFSEHLKMNASIELSQKVSLQSHVYLFKLEYDLFGFRRDLKEKDPDFWSNHHCPTLAEALEKHLPNLKKDQTYYFLLFRNLENDIVSQKISLPQYNFLSQLKNETSIENALENIPEEDLSDVTQNIQQWMHHLSLNQLLKGC